MFIPSDDKRETAVVRVLRTDEEEKKREKKKKKAVQAGCETM